MWGASAGLQKQKEVHSWSKMMMMIGDTIPTAVVFQCYQCMVFLQRCTWVDEILGLGLILLPDFLLQHFWFCTAVMYHFAHITVFPLCQCFISIWIYTQSIVVAHPNLQTPHESDFCTCDCTLFSDYFDQSLITRRSPERGLPFIYLYGRWVALFIAICFIGK